MRVEAMLVKVFFNARHCVGGGPVHPHSWMVEVEAATTAEDADGFRVGFRELEERVREVVAGFEDQLLNDLPVFHRLQPTTENLCTVIFDSLLEACDLPGVMVRMVTLWESPTKGVTVGLPGWFWMGRAPVRGTPVPPSGPPRAEPPATTEPVPAGAEIPAATAPVPAQAVVPVATAPVPAQPVVPVPPPPEPARAEVSAAPVPAPPVPVGPQQVALEQPLSDRHMLHAEEGDERRATPPGGREGDREGVQQGGAAGPELEAPGQPALPPSEGEAPGHPALLPSEGEAAGCSAMPQPVTELRWRRAAERPPRVAPSGKHRRGGAHAPGSHPYVGRHRAGEAVVLPQGAGAAVLAVESVTAAGRLTSAGGRPSTRAGAGPPTLAGDGRLTRPEGALVPARVVSGAVPVEGGAATIQALRKAGHPGEWVSLLLGAVLILLLALWVYWPLVRAVPGFYYPWGSDSWAHLLKAELLYRRLSGGDVYPQFFAGWYNGVQPFRYWGPLTYYLLAGLRWVTGDVFLAGNLYVLLTAAFGGVSWLLFRGYLGPWGAVASGALWTMWADHVRVALSEGNLPRALTTALLPLTTYLFLRLLDGDVRPDTIAGCALIFATLVLSHAMMAAVTAISLAFFAILYAWYGGTGLRQLVRALTVVGAGILLPGWWLLPGLTGGILGIDPQAAAQVATFTPFTVSFDPFMRATNPELFYWGPSLLLVGAAVLLTWRHRPASARAAFIWGLACVLFSLPTFRFVHEVLPLGNVLWPERFASAAAVAFLLAAFAQLPRWDLARPWGGSRVPHRPGAARDEAALLPAAGTRERRGVLLRWGLTTLVVLALALDMSGSFRLVAAGPPSVWPLLTSRDLATTTGWRVATVDLSRLGSAPSFWFWERGGREQVFGWAWQGAATAANLVWINTAIGQHRYGFALDRLVELGATDLVVKKDAVDMDAFAAAAAAFGFRPQVDRGPARVFHRELEPYLLPRSYEAIAIGRAAPNWAMMFPGVEVGRSSCLDDFTRQELERYRTIILSGFSWRKKVRAEALAAGLAAAGKRVVVDLTGVEKEVLSKRAYFLGVYAEPMSVQGGLDLTGAWGHLRLAGFTTEEGVWEAFNLQGLDEETVFTHYLGERATLLGFKDVGGGKVCFVGANIPFHAFQTGDAAGLALLGDVTGLSPHGWPDRTPLPITSYRPDARGVSLTFEVPEDRYPHGGSFIVPVAALDAFSITLDGRPVPVSTVHNLLAVDVGPGSHRLRAEVTHTPGQVPGLTVSVAALLLVASLAVRLPLAKGPGLSRGRRRAGR